MCYVVRLLVAKIFLSRHLNSKIRKPKMEEIERERERIMKELVRVNELRELEDRLEMLL